MFADCSSSSKASAEAVDSWRRPSYFKISTLRSSVVRCNIDSCSRSLVRDSCKATTRASLSRNNSASRSLPVRSISTNLASNKLSISSRSCLAFVRHDLSWANSSSVRATCLVMSSWASLLLASSPLASESLSCRASMEDVNSHTVSSTWRRSTLISSWSRCNTDRSSCSLSSACCRLATRPSPSFARASSLSLRSCSTFANLASREALRRSAAPRRSSAPSRSVVISVHSLWPCATRVPSSANSSSMEVMRAEASSQASVEVLSSLLTHEISLTWTSL